MSFISYFWAEKITNMFVGVLDRLIRKVFVVTNKILLRIHKGCEVGVLDFYASNIQDVSINYYSYKLQNKKAKAYKPFLLNTDSQQGELAIVLQGLPEIKDNFTLETIRLYHILFPGAFIIFSTWDTVQEEIVKQYENEGCYVVINRTLENNGPWNVNCQICTTRSGIIKAMELGAKYVLKNRSDLRIYRKCSFEYLKGLLKIFPLSDGMLGLKSRIISLSGICQGQLFYPYWIQDFLYFGYCEDLLDLFSIPYDSRVVPLGQNMLRLKFGNKCTAYERWLLEGPEIYITKRFLEKHIELENTVKQHMEIIKKYFIILSQEDLDIIWPKYKRFLINSYDRNQEYDGELELDVLKGNINFQQFVALYNNSIYYNLSFEDINKEMIVYF